LVDALGEEELATHHGHWHPMLSVYDFVNNTLSPNTSLLPELFHLAPSNQSSTAYASFVMRTKVFIKKIGTAWRCIDLSGIGEMMFRSTFDILDRRLGIYHHEFGHARPVNVENSRLCYIERRSLPSNYIELAQDLWRWTHEMIERTCSSSSEQKLA